MGTISPVDQGIQLWEIFFQNWNWVLVVLFALVVRGGKD